MPGQTSARLPAQPIWQGHALVVRRMQVNRGRDEGNAQRGERYGAQSELLLGLGASGERGRSRILWFFILGGHPKCTGRGHFKVYLYEYTWIQRTFWLKSVRSPLTIP
jgi:hypothetical protein